MSSVPFCHPAAVVLGMWLDWRHADAGVGNPAALDALKNLTKRVNGLESKIDVVIKAVR